MGLGWQVGEDALDKYLVVRIETWTRNPVILMLVRSFLNPTRSFANAMSLSVPWARATRPGIWRAENRNRNQDYQASSIRSGTDPAKSSNSTAP
jgi:hypothetical protein